MLETPSGDPEIHAPRLIEAYQRLLGVAVEARSAEELLRDCIGVFETLPWPIARRPVAALLVESDHRTLRLAARAGIDGAVIPCDDRHPESCVCSRALEDPGEVFVDAAGGGDRAPCVPSSGGTHFALRLGFRGSALGVLHLLLEPGGRPSPEESAFLTHAAAIIGAELRRCRREEEHDRLETQFLQAQKMEAIGRLAGGVAHDFNNILTAITSYAELGLLKLPAADPMRRNFEEVLAASDRAALLTQQLLAFSRRQVLAPRVIDLNAVIAEMGKLLRRLLGEDVELIVRTEPGLPRICADPAQLEQVIVNLAVNSRDAMPRGGKLLVETRTAVLDAAYCGEHPEATPGPCSCLAVSDTGAGMTEEVRRKIFEPFFTTKEQHTGSGLGLAAVYGAVRQSGGHVLVYSEPGIGTTFKIYFPIASGEPERDADGGAASRLPRGSETVLVAEDDETVRAVTVEVLAGLGYRIIEAREGSEALAAAASLDGPLDLLLTDVVMPRMSGRDLYRALVAERPDLRVLFISGYTDDAIVHHGVLEPGASFLQKPFSPAAIAARVREVLDNPRP